jgi:serine/threonine-protein kinase
MAARGPQPGDLVGGRYRLELLIGTGGMGAVWSAAVEGSARGLVPTDEKVAIKFLHGQMAADPLIVQRFLLEARAGTEIRHPNVVRMLASGWLELGDGADSVPWLAMELLSGKTLSDVLRKRPRLEGIDAVALAADVAAGAAAAHAAKIVHRDLKPANVFLQQTSDGGVIPKILDFGISKFVEPGLDGGLTTTGAVVGSAMYMSPEQATGGYQVDLRSDVWSLGILLYRLLTGESPLPPTHQDIMVALVGPKELDLAALHNARIPPSAAAVVRRCLRKKREERYDSAQELEKDLRAAVEGETERAGRKPLLGALLADPSTSVTLITAPIAREGDLDTVISTAPTGVVEIAADIPRSRVAPSAIPYDPTLASHVPRPSSVKRSRARMAAAAGAVLAISGIAVAGLRMSTHAAADTANGANSANGPVGAASSSATAEGTAAAPSAAASTPVAASSVATTTGAPPPTADPPERPHPRASTRAVPAKGAGPHPASTRTTPPAAAASTAPEPWRRPGF